MSIDKITRDHVLQAVEKIENEKITLHPSTDYDVIIDGKAYPPKEVMKHANFFANGILGWSNNGGPRTNKYLEKFGFEIRNKSKEKPAINTLFLKGASFYKMSHGDFRRNRTVQFLDEKNWISLYERTGRGQGEVFKSRLKRGDFVYVCYGRGRIGPIARITSDWFSFPDEDRAYVNGEDGWICRTIEPVCWPIDNSVGELTLQRSKWLPSGYSTIQQVPSTQIQDYNKLIGIPKYHVSITVNDNDTIFSAQMQPLEALNSILYGPPGTGKTYALNAYKRDYFTDIDIMNSPGEVLRDIVGEYSYWEIVGAILLSSGTPMTVSEIVKHPLMQAKVNPANKVKPNQILWSVIQSYANDQSTASSDRRDFQPFHKLENSHWSIDPVALEELRERIDDNLVELARNPDSVRGRRTEKHRYRFITFHQKYSYEDFIEGIKPLLSDESQGGNGQLQFHLKKGLFYESCLDALQLAGYTSFKECSEDTRENRKARFEQVKGNPKQHFALFIDEINRANISAVFGELITLLEDDKRIGGDQEMWLQLPYSGETFCVPSNLYVVGTMNTADRSIALLDIALRRRFEFRALYPEYPEGEWWSSLLVKLNESIQTVLRNPDFYIGHAFFIDKPDTDKSRILNRKVIPLLYEYCQNNSDKVKRILQDAEIQITQGRIMENYQIVAD